MDIYLILANAWFIRSVGSHLSFILFYQVRMKAICVLEAILRKNDNDHFSVIASYFIENRDLVVKCSELPQSSLREKANKVCDWISNALIYVITWKSYFSDAFGHISMFTYLAMYCRTGSLPLSPIIMLLVFVNHYWLNNYFL